MRESRRGGSPALRPFAVALAALVVVDLVLRLPVFPLFPDDHRVPRATAMALEEYVDWQARRDGVRVAVVGDSVSQGYLMERSQTFSARLDDAYEAAGRDVNVHDLGLSAATGGDMAGVIGLVTRSGAADVIVVQFDYVLCGSLQATSRFPELSGVPATAPPEPLPARVDGAAGDGVRAVWRLAASRDWIDAALLDGSPAAALKRILDARDGTFHPGGEKPVRLAYDRINLALLEKMWAVPRFDDTHPQLSALRGGLAEAREAGVPVVVVMGPLNRDLSGHHGFYDDATYRANAEYLRALCGSEGARFVDLSDCLPPEQMIDSVHPLPEGNVTFARAIADAIEPEVAAAELARGGR